MKNKYLRYVIGSLLLLSIVFSATFILGTDLKIGMDGEPIVPGEEITNGMGIIDEISFENNYVVIKDIRFLLDEELVLIDKGNKNASPSIFVEGVRVVWTVRGGNTAIELDHYPFDENEQSTATVENTPDQQPAAGNGNSVITKDADGVYRN